MKTPLDFVRQALATCRKERDSNMLMAKWSREDERIISRYSGMQISWDSVEKKITEQEWERIAHT